MSDVLSSFKGKAVEFFVDVGLTRILVASTAITGLAAAVAYHYDGFTVREEVSSSSTSGGDTTTELSVVHHHVPQVFNLVAAVAYLPPLFCLAQASDADNMYQTIKSLEKAASFNQYPLTAPISECRGRLTVLERPLYWSLSAAGIASLAFFTLNVVTAKSRSPHRIQKGTILWRNKLYLSPAICWSIFLIRDLIRSATPLLANAI
ncbi:MAG: hypothetical protein Q8P67_17115, partial [archaeon]|nr:hypothetical protein [archaeon]